MATQTMLEKVKTALGIEGDYQNATLSEYIDEVTAFLNDGGVPTAKITAGIVARGVTDLWNYGAGGGELSAYFIQRASQLALRG